jgi:hypothetical protein
MVDLSALSEDERKLLSVLDYAMDAQTAAFKAGVHIDKTKRLLRKMAKDGGLIHRLEIKRTRHDKRPNIIWERYRSLGLDEEGDHDD